MSYRRIQVAVFAALLMALFAKTPLTSFAQQPPKGKKLKDLNMEPLQPLATLGIPRPMIPPETKPKLLSLNQVLRSVAQHYPLLLATFQERGIAEGNLLTAEGSFDLKFKGFERVNQGSFDSHRFLLGLDQPLAFQGMSVFSGYRMGAGVYPSYYQDRQTAEGGEFFAGLTLPLLQNRQIDNRRASLQKAGIGRALAEPNISNQSIDFARKASFAYWDWVAAAKRYEFIKQLLKIAEDRDVFLRKQAKGGAIAPINIVDNRRTIADRRSKVILFQRKFEQASIDLSLFLRDNSGKPQRPEEIWLPPEFPEPILPDPQQLPRDVEIALNQRPELQAFQLRRQQLQVDLGLAENETLPSLNLVLDAAQDVGDEKATLDRARYQAGLLMEVPLQRRVARGKVLANQAKLAQLNAQQQFISEKIVAEVENIISALVRAYELRQQAKQNVDLNKRMVEAETKKLALGKSNILFVNLREIALAEAQLQEVDSLTLYYRSYANYQAILGVDTLRLLIETSQNFNRHPFP